MLAEFVAAHRHEIFEQTRLRVADRVDPPPMADVFAVEETGVGAFLDQLVSVLQNADGCDAVDRDQIALVSGKHGEHLFYLGQSIGEVVREYGDVCQTVTSLALKYEHEISVHEFRVLNLCLDYALAGAVTAFAVAEANDAATRHASLVHELRNTLGSATLSFEFIQSGGADVHGRTGKLHARSLAGLGNLISNAIAEVRLDGRTGAGERMRVVEFVADIVFVASLSAAAGERKFKPPAAIDVALGITGDRQLLVSAISNLIQNALKHTPKDHVVELRVRADVDRVFFEVEDECGGLPPGDLFAPFGQFGSDRTGLGLGLPIALKAARANGGGITVRDIPGHGCVFTLDLPRTPPPSGLYELKLPTPIPPPLGK